MRNALHTGKTQTRQPPVQLLSCEEGKYIVSETHVRRTGYDAFETEYRFQAFMPMPQGKGESALH